MNHYIFSYGSLAHKEVAELTGKTLAFLPAILKDYQRNFRVRAKDNGFTAAGIEMKTGAETFGMLVEVPEKELKRFDEREYPYDRLEIDFLLLSLPGGKDLPQGHYYLYVPKNSEPPTEDYPLAQSYIDVMLTPFLSLDPEQAVVMVRAMTDLERPWVNDREMPRYSRYPSDIDVEAIDELLRRAVPEFLESRILLHDYRIRPELVQSIFSTIRFYNLFDFPLTIEELRESLYKYTRPLHIKELKATLDHLVQSGELSEIKGYYVLAGREPIVEIRKTRKFIAEKFWNRTKLYGQYMRSVPFTRMIAVCNNLAYDNPSEQSDIDLFIVVQPGRMWMARFLITVILHFFGVRRYGNKVAGRFCLSFFVTTNKIAMQEFELEDEDPYLAYWTRNLRPIFGKDTYQKFCEQNKEWLAGYGLSFSDSRKKHMYHYEDTRVKKIFEWLFSGFLGNGFEKLLKVTLKKKTLNSMRGLGEKASVVVTDEVLKFHNHDRRREFLERWREKND